MLHFYRVTSLTAGKHGNRHCEGCQEVHITALHMISSSLSKKNLMGGKQHTSAVDSGSSDSQHRRWTVNVLSSELVQTHFHSKIHSLAHINPLNPELNPICYLPALLGAYHFLHVSRIRVKLLTFRLLMSYIYGAHILDVSRSHTTTQHSR